MPAQINPEESELLYLVQSDDESAFRTIYIMYSPRLYKNILRFVRIEEVAQDLLHDLFIKVWDKRHTIDPQKPFKAFIFKIAENLVYDFFRKASRERDLKNMLLTQYHFIQPALNEIPVDDKYASLLHAAVETLSPIRKKVFELCKYEKKSYEEAAVIMGISKATVSDHMVKATKAIRHFCMKQPESFSALAVAVSLL
ncbi:MAG: sigma-70 family RNA polymerase sigma factor [Sphingobacteriales bacterium]|jgi:RNA polymerase sigma-70 factor (ECF subfamily)|nr:sigma-70 family RNA polymerase sigma factor [Sphingobacteriales bacterium]OJY87603.1 MAG: hypothetical protein BGP14_12885 [Sphingobacteriales bacterium 44-15]